MHDNFLQTNSYLLCCMEILKWKVGPCLDLGHFSSGIEISMCVICVLYSSLIFSFSFFLVPACDELIPGNSNNKFSFFFLWRYCQNPASAASLLRFLDHAPLDTHAHTQTHTHTNTHTHTHTQTHTRTHTYTHTNTHKPGNTLLNEVSARHRGSYLLNIKQTPEMNIYGLSGIRTHSPVMKRP